jgi:predicted transcriptional regulator
MEVRDAILLRLPTGLKERVEKLAVDHRRSTNREIQVAIEAYLARPKIELR